MSDNKKKLKEFSIKELVSISFFAVVIVICSMICIPGPVPLTFQTFAIFCTFGILGGRKGVWAVLVYILLGLTGLPVFSGFRGGVGALFGATGGYIFGFVLSAAVYGIVIKLLGKSTIPAMIAAMTASHILCYVTGTLWYICIHAGGGDAGLVNALRYCVLPFILTDIIKIVMAAVTTDRVTKRLRLKN